ncbi:MAG TPA: hypothetical protein VJ984_00530 [Xanthomonadales bacterium]|nr:hypothetical protein [Xanthomonadales bacterium]
MFLRISILLALVFIISSCGGESGDGAEATVDVAARTDSAAGSTEPIALTRQSIVLCEALKGHRQELASIVGFQAEMDRSIAGVGSECFVRGKGGDFIRVAIPPAIVRSTSMYAEHFEGTSNPLPELGEEAYHLDDGSKPHVIFMIGEVIIDVEVDYIETPDQDAVVKLALRVRELLQDANS